MIPQHHELIKNMSFEHYQTGKFFHFLNPGSDFLDNFL